MSNQQLARAKTILLSHASPWFRKVAMIMVKTIYDLKAEQIEFENEQLHQCLRELVSSGQLVAAGNIDNWRHSEVKLPGPEVN